MFNLYRGLLWQKSACFVSHPKTDGTDPKTPNYPKDPIGKFFIYDSEDVSDSEA